MAVEASGHTRRGAPECSKTLPATSCSKLSRFPHASSSPKPAGYSALLPLVYALLEHREANLMATSKGPVAVAHTSALPYSRGCPISVLEMSPQLRPRTDDARAATTTCCLLSDSRTLTATPTYESQRAMRAAAAAAAAATAQQGYDNIYMLEMLEDDAIDALAAEIKEFALEWVRGGIAWWKAAGKVDPAVGGVERRSASSTGNEAPPSGLLADAMSPARPQKKPAQPSSVRAGRWTKHVEVKRKEEEQRERARRAHPPTSSNRSQSMPSLCVLPSTSSTAEPTFPPAYSLRDPLKPLPALPTTGERSPKQDQQTLSFGTGRRQSAPQLLRRRRAGCGDFGTSVDRAS